MKLKLITYLMIAIVVMTVGIFGRAIAFGQEANLKTIKVGGGSFTTSIAQANGLFAKYGLQIQIPRSASGGSDEVRKWLASGELDLADYGVDNAIAMVENAGVDVILVAATDYTPTELMAQPVDPVTIVGILEVLRGNGINAGQVGNPMLTRRLLPTAREILRSVRGVP